MLSVEKLTDELKIKQEQITEKIKALPHDSDCFPVIDGIIDVERYAKAKYKILWILKEANYGNSLKKNSDYGNIIDFYQRPTTTMEKISKIPTAKRVMHASYKILHNLDILEAFKSIAWINIKKTPGGSKANDAKIRQAFNDPENRKLLLEQIEAYAPDIIIFGYTLQYFEKDINFRQDKNSMGKSMGKNHYYCTKERLYINAYHPASFKITEKEYCDKIFNAFSYWKSK
jgi:hypothetical protein